MTTCPTCGAPVRVVSADEGTQSYEPIESDAEARIAALEGALLDVIARHDPPLPYQPCNCVAHERARALLAATPAPVPPTLDVDRLREAVWNANRENAWCEAVDTTDRMTDQIAREYAALAAEEAGT